MGVQWKIFYENCLIFGQHNRPWESNINRIIEKFRQNGSLFKEQKSVLGEVFGKKLSRPSQQVGLNETACDVLLEQY